jgi:hypothetical protein
MSAGYSAPVSGYAFSLLQRLQRCTVGACARRNPLADYSTMSGRKPEVVASKYFTLHRASYHGSSSRSRSLFEAKDRRRECRVDRYRDAATGRRVILKLSFTRSGLVHPEAASIIILGIEFFDGAEPFLSFRHFHKPESLRSSCGPVHNDFGCFHSTVLLKKISELIIARPERNVSHVDVNAFHLETPFLYVRGTETFGSTTGEMPNRHISVTWSLGRVRQNKDLPVWDGHPHLCANMWKDGHLHSFLCIMKEE